MLFRIPYDAASPWGLGGDAEIYHFTPRAWEPCPAGRMPEWVDNFQEYSLVNFFNEFTSSIVATTKIPGYRYLALGVTVLIVASNSTGGVMGKMIDAQSIVVAAVATEQADGEGKILRFVFWHSVALAALIGLLTMVQAYWLTWMIPQP